MNEYIVVWVVEVSADSPEDAARRARAMQLDPDSTALTFDVGLSEADSQDVVVDLSAFDGQEES